jgi:lysophospholipase L1-like esterase
MFKSKFNKIESCLLTAIALIAASVVVSLITLCVNGSKPVLAKKNAQTDAEISTVRLGKTPDYGQAYINNIVFLGDSTISGLSSTDLLTESIGYSQIWTGEDGDLALDYNIGNTSILFPETSSPISITSAAERKKPDYIIVTVGINNGVAYCSEEKFTEYYEKLITTLKEASPSTRIILQSILPISNQAEKSLSGITNEKIGKANKWIEKIAENNSLRYLDTASVLKNTSGQLSELFDSGDGIHLNTEGFAAMLDYIRTHGYK